MKHIVFVLVAAVVVAAADSPTTYTVHWQGTLHAVHSGDVSGKVPLRQFSGKKNLYAVGPVAGLDGEVTAVNGQFYIARVRDGRLETSSDLSISASFLVWSEVREWQSPVLLGEKVDNLTQLEKLIEGLAGKAGIDTKKPFPFLIDGVFDAVDYHILVPRETHHASIHHNDGGKNISIEDRNAKIIGFFSKHHEGVFTHRGSATHLHILEENGSSGHVDNLVLSAEVRISFPK